MEIIFEILSLLGGLMFLSSVFYLKPGVPVASFNPKHWKPLWKMQDSFRGPGYALAKIGLIWMSIGGLGRVIIYLTT